MFSRILVPLDGSPRAEMILPQLGRVLRHEDAELLLLRSVDATSERAEAGRYLHDVARRFAGRGAKIHARIVAGPPAEAILRAADDESATLIAMATHGRTGLDRFTFGSVAEKVIRASDVPVLVVRSFRPTPDGDLEPMTPEELPFRKILVPVDGPPSAAALRPAVQFARLFNAKGVFLHVVKDEIDSARDPATAKAARCFQAVDLKTVRRTVVGDPASAILDQARGGRRPHRDGNARPLGPLPLGDGERGGAGPAGRAGAHADRPRALTRIDKTAPPRGRRRRVSKGMMTTLLLLALGDAPVKVYILAGQSNMEGKGAMRLAESQSASPEFKDDYKHLKPDGKWVVRDDVWINFLDRRGPLTVGYGSPNCVGPELEFGMKVGDAHPEQVLLIKAAWGGRSLGRDFLPPSAKQPTDEELKEIAAKEKKPATVEEVRARYGKAYREMLAEVRTTLAEIGQRFPAYQGQGTELAGFVWFQGWNDHIHGPFADAYEANLKALIRDLRKDLNAPKLPVVLGQMGQCGFKPPSGGMKKVNDAMAAAGAALERVKVVATAPLWDAEADKLYPTWRENKEAWDKVGSDHGYHYLGSVRFFCRAGRAFGEAMLSFK